MSSSRALEEPAAKYFLEFNLKARKEFDSLAAPIRLQLAKKLKTRQSSASRSRQARRDAELLQDQAEKHRLSTGLSDRRRTAGGLGNCRWQAGKNQVYGTAAIRISH